MPSPFPGMDPFLEEPGRWSDFHHRMINQISDLLMEQIVPDFFVRIAERVYRFFPEAVQHQLFLPNLYFAREQPDEAAAFPASSLTPPTLVVPLYDLDLHDYYLEIRTTAGREVVTTIELLAPFNKFPGIQGFAAFQRKRQAVLASPTHWLEIDLLRAGERPREVAGQSDYYALLKRGGGPGPFAVWYIDLRDRLPTIAVPLRPPFPDVPLDLQAAFNTLYTRAYYALSIDYSRPVPPPPLPPADADWVAACLQRWQEQPG